MSSISPVNDRSNPANANYGTVEAWEQAASQAKEAGIRWERPAGDDRSAQEIIDASPLLKNLGNQSGVRDMLEGRVGDIDSDPDAAYRAAQILEHVEKFDENGERIVNGGDLDNGRVDGFTKGGDAKHGTEAGRLQDFGKYGYTNLKGELQDVSSAADDRQARQQAEALGIGWERPDGDDRSAREIIDASPLLRDLGNQSGVRDMLKERVGDFENDADAAYRAAQVLEHIERFDGDGNRLAGNDIGNGRVDGFTKGGDAKHDTEAGRLQDFGKYGFANLKGELLDPATAGGNERAREEAEALGIDWELPDDDKRSAEDIIDDSPLLKNLGNQSGVKDMLKERVGDFEHDANAAYRAAQVLDRIVMYDGSGNTQSGDGVSNTSIDGFTKSGEAKHGTEAGRLQDFGKYGFDALQGLKKPEDIGSYKDFLKANPSADETSKTIAKYAAILGENYDVIKGKIGADGNLTAADLKRYAEENPQIGKDFKEALDFWSQPGAFGTLETAADPLKLKPDGVFSGSDVTNWLKSEAPKDANAAIAFLSDVANANAVANVDPSRLNQDIFDHPENHSTEEKAAALQELLTAQKLIVDGAAAGMWSDDYGKVSIANAVRGHPDPDKLLEDLNSHIETLSGDPAVAKYLSEHGSSELGKLLDGNEGLKSSLQKTYDEQFKSGKALDGSWDAQTKDGKTDRPAALAEFFRSANMYQEALGIHDTAEIQSAVGKSEHVQEFKDFYEKSLVTGDRFRDLLKTNSFEKASSEFAAEVALCNGALDPAFTGGFDKTLNDNFTKVAQENAFKDASFEDLKKAFGVNGGDQLDEAKVKHLIEEIGKTNPELLVNSDGTVATPDQVLAGVRANWDILRQGTKTLNELGLLSSGSEAKGASDRGVLHGVSGLFMAGVTIAKGANNAGNLTDRQTVDIATGSVQSATLLAEGGVKNYTAYLKDIKTKLGDAFPDILAPFVADEVAANEKLSATMKRYENAAKGVGGVAGVAAGAYAIFDGVQSIRKGDAVSGGISIAGGSIGIMAGLASAVEGGIGAFAPQLMRAAIPLAAGALGWIAAGVGVIASLLPGLIAEGKQQKRQDDFGDLLGSYLTKYGIDGVPNGDIWDIPDEEWPGEDSTIAS